MNFYHRIRAQIAYRLAVLRADRAAERTGFDHYVIPAFRSRRLLVVQPRDRVNLHKLQLKGYLPPRIRRHTITHRAFYHAAPRPTSKILQNNIKQKKHYLHWYETKITQKHQTSCSQPSALLQSSSSAESTTPTSLAHAAQHAPNSRPTSSPTKKMHGNTPEASTPTDPTTTSKPSPSVRTEPTVSPTRH